MALQLLSKILFGLVLTLVAFWFVTEEQVLSVPGGGGGRRNVTSAPSPFNMSTTTTTSMPPSFCTDTMRCATLNRTRRFSFVHISKSGGASWIEEIKAAELRVFPTSEQGAEHSVVFQNGQDQYDHLSYHLTSLRSPRHHTWSLWSECRFDRWGEGITRRTKFPRRGQDAAGDVLDFTAWMEHFVDNSTNTLKKVRSYDKAEWYNCYHPANYQSRPFVSTSENPHGLDIKVGLNPSPRIAAQTYWNMDWVGITEFYHESKCLLYFRMAPRTEAMQDYIDQTCHCHQTTTSVDNNNHSDAELLHHTGRRRKTMRDLPSQVLHLIAAATKADVRLYKVALFQFLQEVAWLERSLSRRILCDHVLHKWEPELAYLRMNLTELYEQTTTKYR